MKLFRLIVLGITFLSMGAYAQKITCSGKLALLNGAIKVDLDTDNRKIHASTSEGDLWDGNAEYFYSGFTKRHYYFLPTGFGRGIELELYKSGEHKVCISPDRCTVCAE